VTEEELLDLVRHEIQSRGVRPQPRTAARCRACYAENESHRESCHKCGHSLARAQAGRAVACPEAGATDSNVTFVVSIGSERRAILGPGGRLVVGRGELADVWLEGPTVSRAHLELVWDETAALPRFRDLGSANGTRHRGLLRAEGVLRPGDTLEVGPYHVSFLREERPSILLDETDGNFDAYFDQGPELQGQLGRGTASLLLRALAAAERTGTFEVALDRGTGSIVLAAGRVVAARCGKTVGLAALHVILSTESGAYHFRRTFEIDDAAPVDMSVEQVLAAVPC
jgi:hypothetical protein